ncbi:uncharacterized protein LOC135205677 [Macrobrachium nipponense]|uniref:uncharacterized protein LOC135205677 n=1 Tax=Macrobrachium nipponense TaxID=159736 RepID=UPI0030C86981
MTSSNYIPRESLLTPQGILRNPRPSLPIGLLPDPTQHSPAQPSTARLNPAQPGPTQHSPLNPAQPGPTQHNPAQPSSARPNPTSQPGAQPAQPAQPSTTQHNPAQPGPT